VTASPPSRAAAAAAASSAVVDDNNAFDPVMTINISDNTPLTLMMMLVSIGRLNSNT